MLRRILPLLLLVVALAWLAGCSSSTDPEPNTPSDLSQIDPGSGDFTLKTIDFRTPDGTMLTVALLGSNMQLHDNDMLTMDISLQNRSHETITGPIIVWAENFLPADVGITNADIYPFVPGSYGMTYLEELRDGVLEPREISKRKTWEFRNPGMGSFSFSAHIDGEPQPEGPVISGYVLPIAFPLDEKDEFDPVPPPFGIMVTVTSPDSLTTTVMPDQWGYYEVPIQLAGMYEVLATSLSMGPCGPEVISPNPLQVIVTPNPDGTLNGFDEANFVYQSPCWPEIVPVNISDLPPEDIPSEDWTLIDAELDGPILELEIGFSGCDPNQYFMLHMTGGFMESMPVQAHLVLEHEITQDCDAWFQDHRTYDLMPIIDRYIEAYGPGGEIILRLSEPNGTEHSFVLKVPGAPDIPPVILTDRDPDTIPSEGWTLQGGELIGTHLHLDVGYSGCDPRQEFVLYMTGDFSQTGLVHANLVLQHEVTQMCLAYFIETQSFDLMPIAEKFREEFNSGGEVHLELIDPLGMPHMFVLEVPKERD